LLLAQLLPIPEDLSSPEEGTPMLSRREISLFHGALISEAPLPFQE
jgi:hypothetical protein